MFFCKIKKKGVVKPQCSGLKKIITKPQEFPEVLANIKTNKHKETGGGKKGKENTKTLTRSQNCQCVSLIMSSVTFSVCNDPPHIKLLFASRHCVPAADLSNEIRLTFTPELLCRVSQPATLGRVERLIAIPNSILKVMFAQTVRTMAITFYCL